MAVYGADPEALRNLAQQLDQAAQQMTTLGRTTSTALRGAAWKGGDADAFRDDWDGVQIGKVTAAVHLVQDAAKALRRNADEQTRTSSVEGPGGGTGGSSGGSGGTGSGSGGSGSGGTSGSGSATTSGGGSVTASGSASASSTVNPDGTASGDADAHGQVTVVPPGTPLGIDKIGLTGDAHGHYEVGKNGVLATGYADGKLTVTTAAGTFAIEGNAQAMVVSGVVGHYTDAHHFDVIAGGEASASATATTSYTDPTGHVTVAGVAQASAIAGGHVSVHADGNGYTASGAGGLEATATVGGSGTVHAGAFSLTGGAQGGVGVGGSYSGDVSATSTDIGFDLSGNFGILGDLGTNIGVHVNPQQLVSELGGAYTTVAPFVSAGSDAVHDLGNAGSSILHDGGSALSSLGGALGL